MKASWKIILLSTLLVGTLDISAAFIDYYVSTGKNPLNVLKYIASGAFGKAAFQENSLMIAMGLLFHYFFAFCFTFIFFRVYPASSVLAFNRVVTGIVYGIFVWCVMNLLVVQLSKAPHAPLRELKILQQVKPVFILIFMIGLPLTFIAYGYFKSRSMVYKID